jgi:7,8-dihydropterin-6-yl-methyl-4-(beta-D-ribofuranosyl)aminobenzene 5'-phosphate synthase
MPLAGIDRLSVTTVVDNYFDALRSNESVARRVSTLSLGRMPELRAEHGLAHLVEIVRGGTTTRIGFDFGLTPATMNHNVQELGLDPTAIDVLALSHGHRDHWGGLVGFLHAHRRRMRKHLTLHAGQDHFLPRWNVRGEQRAYTGRLDRDEIERYEVAVSITEAPTAIAEDVLLSGEMRDPMPFETIPANLRVERDGEVVQDTFIGEQTLIANVKDRGLVVVTSCSHRGIVGICRHATRVAGVPKVHAVVGGFHLSGLGEERITKVVDAFRDLEVDHIVPQHCTGMEALVTLAQRLPRQMVVASVGSTFVFGE